MAMASNAFRDANDRPVEPGSAMWAAAAVSQIVAGVDTTVVASLARVPPCTIDRWMDAMWLATAKRTKALDLMRAEVYTAALETEDGVRLLLKEAQVARATYYRWRLLDQEKGGSAIRRHDPRVVDGKRPKRQPRGIGVDHQWKAILDVVLVVVRSRLLFITRDRGIGYALMARPLPPPGATMTYDIDVVVATDGLEFGKVIAPPPTHAGRRKGNCKAWHSHLLPRHWTW